MFYCSRAEVAGDNWAWKRRETGCASGEESCSRTKEVPD